MLLSARAADIPKSTHSSPPVSELISLSAALPIMGITLWCVWAAYTTTESLEAAVFTMNSPEVPADAAEPLKVVVLAAVSPQAAVSPEAAAVTSAPCAVVATSNAISACHVAVEETITELRIYPVKENVTAVEPLEVSVVSTCELSACPIMAMEGVL